MEIYGDEVALLVAQSGPLNGQRWAINKPIILGRDRNCDIIITDRQISRNHARIWISHAGVILEDLNSKNGTYCNGQLSVGEVLLKDGDIIQVALAQKFIFISSDATLPLNHSDLEIGTLQEPLQDMISDPKKEVRRLRLEKRSRRVWINSYDVDGQLLEKEILPPLSVSQFKLLELLYENQGKVVPRQDMITTVWGKEQALEISVQALDALVRRLRDRIAEADAIHAYIITIRGHGLRLDNPTL